MNANKDDKTIACPKCGETIDVNAVIYLQVKEELSKGFHAKLAQEKKAYEQKEQELAEQKRQLEENRKTLQEDVENSVREKLQKERKSVEALIRKAVTEETEAQHKAMKEELDKKSEQVKELHKAKADVERLQREKNEIKGQVEAEAEKKLSEAIEKEKSRIEKSAEDRVELKMKDREAVIDQLKKDLGEAQRKAQEASSRAKGEVQEVAIEEWLRATFPLDTVDEIKKGERGADCLHTINTRSRQNCGLIYYESKRATKFQPGWIEKFKEDMLARRVHVGVLVTEAMPPDLARMGLKDGVWICNYEEFKGLCAVLRESVIQINNAIVVQENKGEKMSMLYDYLTSNEFKLQIEAIVDGFTQMKTDLDAEKRSFERAWKTREKQIERVLLNTIHMYSSFKGIAGSALPTVPQLEFTSDKLFGDPK